MKSQLNSKSFQTSAQKKTKLEILIQKHPRVMSLFKRKADVMICFGLMSIAASSAHVKAMVSVCTIHDCHSCNSYTSKVDTLISTPVPMDRQWSILPRHSLTCNLQQVDWLHSQGSSRTISWMQVWCEAQIGNHMVLFPLSRNDLKMASASVSPIGQA